jgi:hypothetical protein
VCVYANGFSPLAGRQKPEGSDIMTGGIKEKAFQDILQGFKFPQLHRLMFIEFIIVLSLCLPDDFSV